MTCLVTGNLTYIGWAKMEALGIKKLFTEPYFGGFGSDFCSGNLKDTWKDRAELVRIAAKKASKIQPGALPVSRLGPALAGWGTQHQQAQVSISSHTYLGAWLTR